MSNEPGKMTREEILKQLPDEIVTRTFTQIPVQGYTSSMNEEPESAMKMLFNRVKRNPFVPIGLIGTVYFLTRGIVNMGNRQLSQKMMRGRVLAQGFTVVALVAGLSLEAFRERKKEKKY